MTTPHEQFQLFDPLRDEEYEALKADIAKRGVLVPVELDEHDNVLDGHHRQRAANELGVDYPKIVRTGWSEQDKIEHVLKINLLRRHLGPVAWARGFRQLAEARGVRLERGGDRRSSATVAVDTAADLAREVGVPPRTAQHRMKIAETLAPSPALAERVDAGEISFTEAKREIRAEQTQQRRESSRAAAPLTDTLDLRIGDARNVLADVADDSVALVLTDPPYGDESGPLYEWLGEWAARVLVPGGSLVCYTGQSRLDRDMRLLGGHLRYWWLLAMMHNSSQRLAGKFVVAEFKPVLWYVKDHRRGRTLVTDVLRPVAKDKLAHDWGQGEGGAGLLIEQLTDPGELVADPFAGTAGWGLLSQQMGRRWVGADVAQGGSTEIVT